MIKVLLRSMRIPFLVLTPACIFIGLSTSILAVDQISCFDFLLVLLGGCFAHISVNTFNEYCDYKSGLDARTEKTPFSGGSGALIDAPEALNTVLYAAIISLMLTILIGLYFVLSLGVSILPLGLVGVLIIVTYTPWLNRSPFLCLVASGLAFGPLMVNGTQVVLTGEYSVQALWASLIPFFLVNNLLLLNQFPDISADQSIGRRHFPIVYGVKKSAFMYGVFILAACGVLAIGITVEWLPQLSAIALAPMLLSVVVLTGAIKQANDRQKLIPYLGINVIVVVLTPLLLSIGIMLG